jgi:CTP synthase (UTP-ammonia lyase)
MVQQIYGQGSVIEDFACNYGLNPHYGGLFAHSELRVAGIGPDGEARLVELPTHRFYMATLYLPQLRSVAAQPHPLIVAYLRAAVSAQQSARDV